MRGNVSPPEENNKCLLHQSTKCQGIPSDGPSQAQERREAQLASEWLKSHQPGLGFVTHTSGTLEGDEQGLD